MIGSVRKGQKTRVGHDSSEGEDDADHHIWQICWVASSMSVAKMMLSFCTVTRTKEHGSVRTQTTRFGTSVHLLSIPLYLCCALALQTEAPVQSNIAQCPCLPPFLVEISSAPCSGNSTQRGLAHIGDYPLRGGALGLVKEMAHAVGPHF